MSTKLCKTVLKELVREIDKAAFRAEANFGSVLAEVVACHPEITASEEDWNKLDEQTRDAIIDRAKKTLGAIG